MSAVPAAERAPAASPLVRAAACFLVVFLVAFPKGGIKLGGVPLTWGYLGLIPLFLAFPVAVAAGRAAPLGRARLVAAAALVPFQLVAWGSFLANGVLTVGWTVAFVVAFFFVPLAFLLGFAPWIDRLDLAWLLRLLRGALLFVAVYGIFLFAWRMGTGRWVEIPLLTVNQGDLGELDTKMIDRGQVFKLISTYNNGNLYGIALLILLPLYCWAERRGWRRGVVKLSLLLTLSRTVWVGLLVHEVLQRLYVRRPTVRSVLTLGAAVAVLAAAVLWVVTNVLGFDAALFLLDARLGGRDYQLEGLADATFLPSQPFEMLWEIVYASVLVQFGVLGLVTFVAALAAPVALQLLGCLPQRGTEYKRALVAGLVTWLVVAVSDGGALFIPVMAFYWFVASLLLSDNPTWRGAAGRPEREPGAEAVAEEPRGTLVPLPAAG